MDIFVQKTGERLQLEHSGSALSLLEKLGLSPEVVLIVADGQIITQDEPVDNAQRIELLSVISGG